MKLASYREQLLTYLTAEECAKIGFRIRQLVGTPHRGKNPRKVLRALRPVHLFAHLHWILFGKYDKGENVPQRVMDSLPELRTKLLELPLPAPETKNFPPPVVEHLLLPPPPPHFKVQNQCAGNVWVTAHAWKRFGERLACDAQLALVRPPSQEVERLRAWCAIVFGEAFARAREMRKGEPYKFSLKRRPRRHKIPVRYFVDAHTNLRFVVGAQFPVLFTVEPHG